MYSKKDMNIESYEGQDAFYSGTDEEYEEFLRNADITIDDGDEAEPVENTQRVNLNETINLQNVIDRFKKTAGDIGSGAKTLKDSVVSKIDIFKPKKEDETGEENNADTDDGITEKVKTALENISQNIQSDAKDTAILADKLDGAESQLSDIYKDIALISSKLDTISSKLDSSGERSGDEIEGLEESCSDIMTLLEAVDADVSEIKQAVHSVSKLNDSIFDLKNTQYNTKNAISELETAFARLKRKCVLGVTVLSILSAIVIVLEIILMLS